MYSASSIALAAPLAYALLLLARSALLWAIGGNPSSERLTKRCQVLIVGSLMGEAVALAVRGIVFLAGQPPSLFVSVFVVIFAAVGMTAGLHLVIHQSRRLVARGKA